MLEAEPILKLTWCLKDTHYKMARWLEQALWEINKPQGLITTLQIVSFAPQLLLADAWTWASEAAGFLGYRAGKNAILSPRSTEYTSGLQAGWAGFQVVAPGGKLSSFCCEQINKASG